MRRRLDYQASQLEAVLASHKVRGHIWGGTVTPRLIRFHLTPMAGTRLSQVTRLSEELAMSMGATSCRVMRRGASIDLEFPRQVPGMVRLLPLCDQLPPLPTCTAVLGLNVEGDPLLLRLPSPDVCHVLICGTTGSGKTALARSMIASLALNNGLGDLGLVLIDPKGRGYAPFSDLPHLVRPIARNVDDAVHALEWLLATMERRDREAIHGPRLVGFVDELADLLMVGGRSVEQVLTRLAQRGREAGVHLVACTQKPTAAVLGSLLKSNFPVRVVGSVASPEDAKVAAGIAGTGAERLSGRGDFLLVAKGQTHRLQAAYLPEAEISEVVDRVRAGSGRRLPATTGRSVVRRGAGWTGPLASLRRVK